METIIIHTENHKAKALKQFLEAFEVDYQVEDHDKSPYNSEFVKKIIERSKSAKEGNTVEVDPNDLWGSLGLK